jgi:hypothetical protein
MRRRTSATTWLTRSSVAGGGAISYDPPELDGVFDAVVDIKALPCRGGDVDDAARPPCQRRKRVLIASITARS